jgi:hypothetical protein
MIPSIRSPRKKADGGILHTVTGMGKMGFLAPVLRHAMIHARENVAATPVVWLTTIP